MCHSDTVGFHGVALAVVIVADVAVVVVADFAFSTGLGVGHFIKVKKLCFLSFYF